jgi:hypothetical protein
VAAEPRVPFGYGDVYSGGGHVFGSLQSSRTTTHNQRRLGYRNRLVRWFVIQQPGVCHSDQIDCLSGCRFAVGMLPGTLFPDVCHLEEIWREPDFKARINFLQTLAKSICLDLKPPVDPQTHVPYATTREIITVLSLKSIQLGAAIVADITIPSWKIGQLNNHISRTFFK